MSLLPAPCRRHLHAYLTSVQRLAHTSAAAVSRPPRTKPPAPQSKRGTETPAAAEEQPKSEYYGKLQPYDLAQRLRALTEKGELAAAVDMLKRMPLAAQSTAVWNTLIKAAFDAEKRKLAHSLFADMKRRGHKPNLRTYATLIAGYHRVRDWRNHTAQLQNLHAIFERFASLVESLPASELDGAARPAVRAALAQYLDACYWAGASPALDAAYARMPAHRDARVHAAYLRDALRLDLPPPDKAARVRAVWDEICADEGALRRHVNGVVAETVFRGLAEISPSIVDHERAFAALRTIFALAPGARAPSPPVEPMYPDTFARFLDAALALGHPQLARDVAALVPARADLQALLSAPALHTTRMALGELQAPRAAALLAGLVHALAARAPAALDRAPQVLQGVLKTCAQQADHASAAVVLGALLRATPAQLVAATEALPRARDVPSASWAHFARAAHGAGGEQAARDALVVLEVQAGPLMRELGFGESAEKPRAFRGAWHAALADTLLALAVRAHGDSLPPAYEHMRARAERHAAALPPPVDVAGLRALEGGEDRLELTADGA